MEKLINNERSEQFTDKLQLLIVEYQDIGFPTMLAALQYMTACCAICGVTLELFAQQAIVMFQTAEKNGHSIWKNPDAHGNEEGENNDKIHTNNEGENLH